MEWALTAAVGLMVGISLGVLVELRYVVLMDRKIEHILARVSRVEARTEHEVLSAMKPRRRAKAARRKRARRR
jgi:hypothetical protein